MNPFEKKQLRAPYDILRDIANQGGGKDRPEGSKRTLVLWDLIEEAREFCGDNWKYRRLTTHPKPEPRPDRPLPPGKTCNDCRSFNMCRSLRNISGYTTCTIGPEYNFRPKRKGYW